MITTPIYVASLCIVFVFGTLAKKWSINKKQIAKQNITDFIRRAKSICVEDKSKLYCEMDEMFK